MLLIIVAGDDVIAERHNPVLRDHQCDGFREPGYSKDRRLEPHIQIGLSTDATAFPLKAFDGNKAESATTMLPVITSFMGSHQFKGMILVADAGMVSDAKRNAIDDAGLSDGINDVTQNP